MSQKLKLNFKNFLVVFFLTNLKNSKNILNFRSLVGFGIVL